MRWTGLLLAVACTHTQPPPAPLAVPKENAEGPAALPEMGDGGSEDGGVDGGAPRAGVMGPDAPGGGDLNWRTSARRPDKP